MTAAMPILAAGGEDPTVKIIIGVTVAVFWIIAQIAGALGKKPDKTLPPPAPVPPRPPQRQPQANRQQPQPQRRQKQQSPRRQPPPLRTPAVPTYPTPPVARSRLAESVAENQRTADRIAAAAPKVVPRRQVVDALLRPRNLKQALIVNELIGPPVALRGERE